MGYEAASTSHSAEPRDRAEAHEEVRQLRARVRELERQLAFHERSKDSAPETHDGALRSLEQFRQILQYAPIVVWQFKSDGEIVLSDGSALEGLGLVPGALVGANFFEVFADMPNAVVEGQRVLAGEDFTSGGEFRGRFFQSSYRAIRDAEGKVAYALGLAVDITERVQAEANLKRLHSALEQRVDERTAELSQAIANLDAEARKRKQAVDALAEQNRLLQSILSSIADGVCVCDTDGHFIVFNPAAERIIGRGIIPEQPQAWSEHYGLFLADAVTPVPVDMLPMVRALRGEVVKEDEIYVSHGDVSLPRWINVNAQPVRNADGVITGAVAAFRDVTVAKQATDALRLERRFLEYSLAVHERDRQLIAYELHDGLVQVISASLMYLESLSRRLPDCDPKMRSDLDVVLRMLRDAMKEARLVISGLRPPILDEQGVVAAIEYLIHEQIGFGAPPIEFAHDVTFERLDGLLEAMLFRVVQEALTNLRTHSGAKLGRVMLAEREGRLVLVISDDGVGFDPRNLAEHHFGLQGIRKRVALLRGRVEIESRPGHGTTLTIDMPIAIGPAPAGS